MSLGREVIRALAVLPRAEALRRRRGPKPVVETMRRIGATKPRRSPAERARLQRAIWLADRLLFWNRNCYRRALLEMALDGGAAKEPLLLGFRAGGVPRSGHAWLAGAPHDASAYDAVISV